MIKDKRYLMFSIYLKKTEKIKTTPKDNKNFQAEKRTCSTQYLYQPTSYSTGKDCFPAKFRNKVGMHR